MSGPSDWGYNMNLAEYVSAVASGESHEESKSILDLDYSASVELGKYIFALLDEHPELESDHRSQAKCYGIALDHFSLACHHPVSVLVYLNKEAFEPDWHNPVLKKGYRPSFLEVVSKKVFVQNPVGKCVCLICGVEIDVEGPDHRLERYIAGKRL
jgi:hypothetical protein